MRLFEKSLTALLLSIPAALAIHCGGGVPSGNDESLPLTDEPASTSSEAVKKGRGGINGAGDYCNDPAHLCTTGEGDCDTDSECVAGDVCVANVGVRFGMSPETDVCLPAHCADGVKDSGETGLDCGGECGPCFCAFDRGHPEFCTPGCPCWSGAGDCDTDNDCDAGLVCAFDVGASFGLSSEIDVCVKPHCADGVQGGDETGIDCGGADCAPCPVALVSANDHLLDAAYRALIGLPIDAANLATYSAKLQRSSRETVVRAIAMSRAYREVEVRDAILELLLRRADPTSLATNTGSLMAGNSITVVDSWLLGSVEYFRVHAGNSNAGFVSKLYKDVLRRDASASERNGAMNSLGHGMSRNAIAKGVLMSDEHRTAQVNAWYERFLGRAPSAIELAAQLSHMRAGWKDEQIQANILGSTAFFLHAQP